MSHQFHTALVTTASGVIGGVGKAISAKSLLLSITIPGLTMVIIYAVVSAVAGYVVKKTLDAALLQLKRILKIRKNKSHE